MARNLTSRQHRRRKRFRIRSAPLEEALEIQNKLNDVITSYYLTPF